MVPQRDLCSYREAKLWFKTGEDDKGTVSCDSHPKEDGEFLPFPSKGDDSVLATFVQTLFGLFIVCPNSVTCCSISPLTVATHVSRWSLRDTLCEIKCCQHFVAISSWPWVLRTENFPWPFQPAALPLCSSGELVDEPTSKEQGINWLCMLGNVSWLSLWS